MQYMIEVAARKACGCELAIDFNPDEPDLEPTDEAVGAVLYSALEDVETGLLVFITSRTCGTGHANEKIVVTAQVKVRAE